MNAFTSIVAARAAGDVPSAEDAVVHVGMVRLWDGDLAIRAEQVREVVPRPLTLQPAFTSGGAFVGSIVIRQQVIPVVDLSSTLGCSGDGAEPQVIVVLRDAQELVGLLVHSVLGLTRIRAGEIQHLLFNPSADVHVVSSGFALDGRLVGMIETAAIATLPGVPRVREAARKGQNEALLSQQKVLILSVAGAELALDATLVVATVPGTHVRAVPSVTEDWVGVIDYLGFEIPVIEDIALIGLSGRAAGGKESLVVILRLGEGRLLGMKAERVRRIIGVNDRKLRPLPADVAASLPFFAGSVDDGNGGQSLLLRSDALIESEALQAIASLTHRGENGVADADGPVRGAAGSGRVPQPFLVFRTGGGRRACRLAEIAQIIPLPQDHSRLSCPGSALRGLASHDGGPLTLVDLGGCEPTGPGTVDTRMVLIVKAGGSSTGFIIDGLETIARAVAQAMPGIPPPGETASSFIQVPIRGRDEAVRVCHLERTMAHSTRGQPSKREFHAA